MFLETGFWAVRVNPDDWYEGNHVSVRFVQSAGMTMPVVAFAVDCNKDRYLGPITRLVQTWWESMNVEQKLDAAWRPTVDRRRMNPDLIVHLPQEFTCS